MPTGTFQVRCTASKHACGKPRIVGTSWKNFLANLELEIGTVAPNVASGGSPTMRNQDQIIPWKFLIGNVSQVAVTAAHFPNGSHLGLENSKPFFVHSGLWLLGAPPWSVATTGGNQVWLGLGMSCLQSALGHLSGWISAPTWERLYTLKLLVLYKLYLQGWRY